MSINQIILASASPARCRILENIGLNFTVDPSAVDEDKIKQSHTGTADQLAVDLAIAKAIDVAKKHPDQLVIGSDQVLMCQDRLFNKATSSDDLLNQLSFLRGKTHRFFSAAAVVRSGQVLWQDYSTADLSMRSFSDEFLHDYVRENFEKVRGCVGGYMLEQQGPLLFDSIQGDYFTILGLPLFKLLAFFRTQGIVPI